MAIENKYGKSAVDATRRNVLPLYIDAMAGQISGDFLPISGGTLTGNLTIAKSSGESDLIVNGPAGSIYLYSASSSSGNRGLWVPAHGTGSDHNLIAINTNNESTFVSWGSSGGYFTKDKSLTINTVPSSNRYGLGYNMQDSTGSSFAYVRGLYLTDNMLGMQIETRRQVNDSWVYNTINFGIYADGTRYVTLNAAAQWKAAIGLNKVVNQTTSFSLSGTTLTITNS